MSNTTKITLGELLAELEKSNLTIDALNDLILLKNAMKKVNINEKDIKIVQRKLTEMFLNKFNGTLPELDERLALKMICFVQGLENEERIIDFYYHENIPIAYYKCGKVPNNYTLYSTLNETGEQTYTDLRFAEVDENYKNSHFKQSAHMIIPEINKRIRKAFKIKYDVLSITNDTDVPWHTNDAFIIDADYIVLVDFNTLEEIKVIVFTESNSYGFTLDKTNSLDNWKFNGKEFKVQSLSKSLEKFDPKIGDVYPNNLAKKIKNDNND